MYDPPGGHSPLRSSLVQTNENTSVESLSIKGDSESRFRDANHKNISPIVGTQATVYRIIIYVEK